MPDDFLTTKLIEALNGDPDRDYEVDPLDVYEALETFLPKATYIRLGEALEYCPVHHMDIQICIDDGLHGQEVYEHPNHVTP